MGVQGDIKKIVGRFTSHYYRDLVKQLCLLNNNKNLYFPPEVNVEQLLESEKGKEWLLIGQAAAGLLENSTENRAKVREATLCLIKWVTQRDSLYRLEPGGFFAGEMGWLTAKALVWASDDQLLTQAEAAKIVGDTSSDRVRNAVRDGRLWAIKNPYATNPRQGATLVLRSQVSNVFKGGSGEQYITDFD